MPEQIVHRVAGRAIESEITLLVVADEQSFTFERLTDSFGNPSDERLELLRAWRADAPKHRRLRARKVRTVEATSPRFQ